MNIENYARNREQKEVLFSREKSIIFDINTTKKE